MNFQLSPIEAHEKKIDQIFSDTYAFEIPPYQRPYAWEEDQTRELLSDLLDAMDNQHLSGGVYFLGSIVLVKSPNDPSSKVIDGQQRLTTLTILLSILRDLTSDEDRRFERRAYVFQKANADRGTQDRYRLLLREKDRPFFQKHVQNTAATNNLPDFRDYQGSQQRIIQNATYLRAQLEAVTEERRNKLAAFIIQSCYLVVVAVPTAEAARRIFTVLNSRGLDLTPTDILKADLLERAGSGQESSIASRWEAVEQALGREKMVELFGHIRMLFEREKPRLALEEGFPRFVTPFNDSADSFVTELLEPIADALLILGDNAEIKRRYGPEAARAMRSLERIDNKDWLPPALLAIWKDKQGNTASAGTFLTSLERLAYFLFVTREGVNERIARFAAVMDEFDPRLNREIPAVALELTGLEQKQFLKSLDDPLYPKTRVCKPVLQRLDEALSSGGASYDELVSIEHVLPQTVTKGSDWDELFPDEVERADLTHKLANLVFLTRRINTRASNWDFSRKKKEYFSSKDGTSPFVITQGVLQTVQWTPEHLKKRQQNLLEKLASVWALKNTDGMSEEMAGYDANNEMPKTIDIRLIEDRRKLIMAALSKLESTSLAKNGALYRNEDGSLRAACTLSKRYSGGRPPYWYGYSTQWRDFLLAAPRSFLVLGCMDQQKAYAIPANKIEAILDQLYRTPNKHWHIVLDEDSAQELEIVIPSGNNFPLKQYKINDL